MEPRLYLAVMIRGWLTLAGFGVLGVLGSAVFTVLTPPVYTSTTALLISVTGGSEPDEVRQDAQYVEQTVISLIAVTKSSAVLGPVIARGDLGTVSELADTLTVDLVDNTAILQISAARGSAAEATHVVRAVSEQLQTVAAQLSPGAPGFTTDLSATTIEPVTEPQVQTSPDAKKNALLGAILGLMAGALVALYRESVRTRVRTVSDLSLVTTLPVWPIRKHRGSRFAWLPGSRWRRSDPQQADDRRSEDLRRLGFALDSMGEVTSITPISSASAAPQQTARALADQLADVMTTPSHRIQVLELLPEPKPARVGDPGVLIFAGTDHPSHSSAPATANSWRSALAVVEPGRTNRRAVESLLSDLRPSGSSLFGIVLVNRSPDQPVGIRALIRRLTEPAVLTDPRDRVVASLSIDAPTVIARSTVLVALIAAFLAGLAYGLPFGTNTTLAVAVALAPVWVPAVRRYRFANLLFGLAGAALLSGVLLSGWSSVDHVIDTRIGAETALRFLAASGAVGLILWARTVVPTSLIVLAYGAGMLLTGVMQVGGSPNPWKLQLAFAITIMLLTIPAVQRRTILSVAILLALGLVNALADFRSGFAFCALAAALVIWQARPQDPASKQASRALTLIFLAALAAGSYAGVSYALVGGYLGDELQVRSVEQIEASGSLIAGGRPEWTVTWALMQDNPLGFGVGVVPDAADVLAGERGFSTVGVTFQSEYAAFLFDGQFKLHSVIADLWSNFGPIGLLLGVSIAVILVLSILELISRRRATPLLLFLVLTAMWNLVFGPLYSNLPDIGLTLGLLLSLKAGEAGQRS